MRQRNKAKIGFIALLLGVLTAFLYAADKEWDYADPADGDSPTLGAAEIRELKQAIAERLDVDHFMNIAGGVIATETNDGGKHRQITFQDGGADDTHTVAADEGILFSKDVSAKAELHWQGEDDHTAIQLTEDTGSAYQLNLVGTYANEINLTHTDNNVYADQLSMKDGGFLTLPHDSTDTTEGNVRYMADSDVETITYRTDTAWLTLLTSTTSEACQIKIGTYSGDAGATQGITGVGFQPDAVMVMPLVDDRDVFIKTAGMGTTFSKSFAGNANDYLDDSITALDADGFTVGDGTDRSGAQDHLNESGSNNYAYIAVRAMD